MKQRYRYRFRLYSHPHPHQHQHQHQQVALAKAFGWARVVWNAESAGATVQAAARRSVDPLPVARVPHRGCEAPTQLNLEAQQSAAWEKEAPAFTPGRKSKRL